MGWRSLSLPREEGHPANILFGAFSATGITNGVDEAQKTLPDRAMNSIDFPLALPTGLALVRNHKPSHPIGQ